jgi:hypothetical protein
VGNITVINLGFGVAMGLGMLLLATVVQAETPAPPRAGIVSHVKVLSDHVADVSSIEAWAKSYLKPGMSEQDKALAVWRTVVAHQHQNPPPVEYLQSPENTVTDPLKMFNVYGYGLCSVHASHVAAMARAAGLTARNQTIVRHCVAEVSWDNEWHMLDASLVNYFPKPNGKLASVDEIIASVAAFYAKHPELKGNPEGLEKFRQEQLWKSGPALLASSPFYDAEGLLAATWPWQAGWPESMREYDGSTQFVFEPGYSMGYQVNVQLREGERLTRNWFNKGLHVNMDGGGQPTSALDGKVGEGPMRYLPEYGDIAPGRIGNGMHEYEVPLASGAFRGGALVTENVASKSEDGQGPAVHANDSSKPGAIVFRMPSSYVYLGGALEFDAVVGRGGKVSVLFSENNGLDWKEIKTVTASQNVSVDLKPLVFRRYDYQLKFVLTGAGTGLERLRVRHDIQHSQRPLPGLLEGDNTINFSSDNEGTVTVEGSTQAENRGKQVLYSDFHPQAENIVEPMLSINGKSGSITFPISTPAAMKRLRIFSFYRARSEKDRWQVAASFDGGKTFKDVGVMEGPFKAMGKQFVVTDVPPGTTSAMVRFTGTQAEAALLFNVRIDADYDEPHGGFAPIKVTYVWEENGAEKRDVHVARSGAESWTIHCDSKPLMKSLVVEPAVESAN